MSNSSSPWQTLPIAVSKGTYHIKHRDTEFPYQTPCLHFLLRCVPKGAPFSQRCHLSVFFRCKII